MEITGELIVPILTAFFVIFSSSNKQDATISVVVLTTMAYFNKWLLFGFIAYGVWASTWYLG